MIYQIIGIALLLVFYGCYFAKMVSQRAKGIQTDQIGKGKDGFVQAIEITMKIATYLAPLVEVISILLNTTRFPAGLRIVGICTGAVGVTAFIASVITMHDNWRAGVSTTDQTELVTRGIYQISRNPAFLGFDLVYIGILLMFFNPVLLIVSVFAIVMLHLQILNVEEDFMTATFGEEYMEYRKKVCRYLGRSFYKK